MSSSRTSNSLKNIASNLGLKFLMLGLQFATRTLFIYNLGTVYNGINSLISSVLSFLNIAELGIGSAIIFAMYKPIADEDNEKTVQYINYYKKIYHILGLVVLSIGILLAPFLPYMINDIDGVVKLSDVYIIYVLYLIQSASTFFVFAYRGGFLTACQKDYKLTPINYTSSVLTPVLQGITLIVFKGILGFCIYTAIPIFIGITRSLLNGIFIAKWYPYIKEKPKGKLSQSEKKDIFKNTYGLAIAKISAIINNAIDSIVISALIGVEILGKYHNYQTLILMVTSIVGIIFTSLVPSVGNLNASADSKRSREVFSVINFAAFWIHGLCAIMYFAIVQPFVRIWIGEVNVLHSAPLLVAICLNFLTHGMCYATGVFREGYGLYYQGRYRPIFTAIFNVIFSVILGNFFGIPGIIFATVLSRFITIWWFDAYIVFKFAFGQKPYKYLLDYIFKVIIVFIVGAITVWLCSLHNFTGILEIFINAIIAIIFVNISFLLIFLKSEEFISTKTFVLNFFRRDKSKK